MNTKQSNEREDLKHLSRELSASLSRETNLKMKLDKIRELAQSALCFSETEARKGISNRETIKALVQLKRQARNLSV